MPCKKTGGAVGKCEGEKRWVFEENPFQPHIYGDYRFKPQCIECGQMGRYQATLPTEDRIAFSDCVHRKEASIYQQEKETERVQKFEEERERRLQEDEEERRREKETWWRNYNEYLQSPAWQSKRGKVLRRDDFICQGCFTNEATEVHHLTYEHYNIEPGSEPLFHLVAICKPCHDNYHAIKKRREEQARARMA